jgi:uncharacterized protein (DUF488 family)
MDSVVYTIGHSTRPFDEFLSLILGNSVDVIADVRSQPYSQLNSQFNKDPMADKLLRHGIKYVFLGKELGARTSDYNCYVNGRVNYDRLSQTGTFREGLKRVLEGVSKGYRVALLCSEKEPLVCHRAILVSRHLARLGARIRHIVEADRVEDHDIAMTRLIGMLGLNELTFTRDYREVVDLAYELQGERIAFEKQLEAPPKQQELPFQ